MSSFNKNLTDISNELGYLALMEKIMLDGFDKPTRTGTDARSLTSSSLRFLLTNRDGKMILPLLTTKNVPLRLVLTELIWFINAGHKSQDLASQNNHIWDPNGSREFLDKSGFQDRPEGELGPIYGVQWRHWNGSWKDNFTSVKGIDQLSIVINSIKNDPYGRRHIVTSWNPEQLTEAALPPCHHCYQFVVRPNKPESKEPYWLDCVLSMRSNDLPLGAPFNIASYSLLTHMIAKITKLHAGEFIMNMADCHIYHNQFDGCRIQLERIPKPFPTIEFRKELQSISDLESMKIEDILLVDYKPDPAIKFPFSV